MCLISCMIQQKTCFSVLKIYNNIHETTFKLNRILYIPIKTLACLVIYNLQFCGKFKNIERQLQL